MIKENNGEFYKLMKRWDTMNDTMKGTNTVWNALSEKGMTPVKVLLSSLYLILEAKTLQKLDQFWKEIYRRTFDEGITIQNVFWQQI